MQLFYKATDAILDLQMCTTGEVEGQATCRGDSGGFTACCAYYRPCLAALLLLPCLLHPGQEAGCEMQCGNAWQATCRGDSGGCCLSRYPSYPAACARARTMHAVDP